MTPEIWIDGKRVDFTSAHVVLRGELCDQSIHIDLFNEDRDTFRFKNVDDGDVVCEVPVMFELLWNTIQKKW